MESFEDDLLKAKKLRSVRRMDHRHGSFHPLISKHRVWISGQFFHIAREKSQTQVAIIETGDHQTFVYPNRSTEHGQVIFELLFIDFSLEFLLLPFLKKLGILILFFQVLE